MENQDNQNQSDERSIYIKNLRQWVSVSKADYDNYYRDINAYRRRQQERGRCVCPASKRYLCDMDCNNCRYRRAGNEISLDFAISNEDGNGASWLEEDDVLVFVNDGGIHNTVVGKMTHGAVLKDGTLGTGEIANNAITAAKILSSTITATQLADNAITSGKISSGAVIAGKLATDAVAAANIAAGAVIAGKLATDAVASGNIAAGAVVSGKLAANAVASTNIADGAVATAKLANNAVTATQLADNAVSSGKIASGAVVAGKLGTDAVASGSYAIGDVRMWEGQPKRCCKGHDSTTKSTWTPAVVSLWSPFHATSRETALPWIKPTGAHDMYKANEYMVFTDGKI